MGEMSDGDANPESLEAIFSSMVPDGKMQVMTMPKSKNVSLDRSRSRYLDLDLDISAAYTELVRATIAHGYSLGGECCILIYKRRFFTRRFFTRKRRFFTRK